MQDPSWNRDSLLYHVKDALARFHDRGQLQTSLLIGLLGLEGSPDEPAATKVRRVLREAVESLRPEAAIPYGDPAWLNYRLLWERYMHRRSMEVVCDELGIGHTSYYRHHQQALEAISSIVWEKRRPARPAAGVEGATAASPSQQEAVAEAIRLAGESRRELVRLGELLESVRETILPLLEQQGLSLMVQAADLPSTYADPGMLRQALLGVLNEGVELAASRTLTLRVEVLERDTAWRLQYLDGASASCDELEKRSGIALARGTLGAYGGHLWVERAPEGLTIAFTVPVAGARTILILDDDNDTIRLYRLWLEGRHYGVCVAHSREQLQAQLAQETPDLVLLDVLMPQWDGWSVLQYLRAMPQTARLPVVVCSVLSQPRLALALGANAVLRKPIAEETLLRTIREALGGADNEP